MGSGPDVVAPMLDGPRAGIPFYPEIGIFPRELVGPGEGVGFYADSMTDLRHLGASRFRSSFDMCAEKESTRCGIFGQVPGPGGQGTACAHRRSCCGHGRKPQPVYAGCDLRGRQLILSRCNSCGRTTGTDGRNEPPRAARPRAGRPQRFRLTAEVRHFRPRRGRSGGLKISLFPQGHPPLQPSCATLCPVPHPKEGAMDRNRSTPSSASKKATASKTAQTKTKAYADLATGKDPKEHPAPGQSPRPTPGATK